jgi:enterochelin esterase-like enzyme
MGHARVLQPVSPLHGTAVFLILLVTSVAVAQDSRAGVTLLSPSIAALRRALAEGASNAELDFWTHVQKTGSPLIETSEGSSQNILITFVWEGDSDTRNVVLVNTAIASSDFAEAQLGRIAGTNVWYRTYLGRSDARFAYELSVNDDMTPFDQVLDWGKRTSTFHADPMNRRVFRSTIMGGRAISYVEGPNAPPESWINPQSGTPKGHLDKIQFESKQLGNTRDVWIYTPPEFETLKHAKTALPLLVVFDGGEYVSSVPTPTILDNLLAARRIPPMVAIFLGSPDGQRDQELNANAHFADFIATELVPWARERYPVSSTPAQNIIAGSSSGGLAATLIAYKYPNIFGNVLSQSGAYFFSPSTEEEPELLPRMFANSPPRAVRFYIEVGALESNREAFKGVKMLSSNRHFRDVLRARGYPVTYHEFFGGHSDLNWRGGFADGILALLGRN